MGDNDKKSFFTTLPGVLSGLAALIAALTTAYVTLQDPPQQKISEQVQSKAVPETKKSEPLLEKSKENESPQALVKKVKLERIVVRQDGSVGATDWIFNVQVNGRLLFSLPRKSFNDREGQNVVT